MAANRASGVPGGPRADTPAASRALAPRAETADGVRTILFELEALVAAAERDTTRKHRARSNRARRRARAGRVGTALGLIGTTGMTAHVASATFAGNAPVAQGALTAGTVSITLGGHVDSSQYFDMAVNDMNPGVANARFRLIDVTNAGNLDLKTLAVNIAATAGHSSALDSDATNGIQLLIERCSGSGWSAPSGSPPDSTYTCAGTQTTVWTNTGGLSGVVGPKDLVGTVATGCASPPCTLTAAGTTNHYRFKFWLPSSATNAMQGLTSTIGFTFYGSQRDGTNE